jgi:glyoxylase-like metal-dependent hydrolase (beta-lactamase superfamily II)
MLFRQLFDAESGTFTYLIADAATRACALVDAVREQVDRDARLVEELGLRLVYVFDTHVHADHVTAAGELRRRMGARTMVAREDGPPCADEGLGDGDEITMDGIVFRAIATPGHTAGCLSYLVGERGAGGTRFDRVLTGDALFIRGCGRTDFQNGSPEALYDSVTRKLFALDDATLVYPAHDYKGLSVSTIGEEKRWNPRLGGGKTRDQFVGIMNGLHLPRPKKIDEALPANRACGDLPPPPAPRQG